MNRDCILRTFIVRRLRLWVFLIVTSMGSMAWAQPSTPFIHAVDSIGMTVSDLDRSIDFYSKVLSFTKVSDVEVWGEQYEQLQGIFGLRMRIVRMQLGDEFIELTEYLTPRGRPVPLDTRSHDHWFQHIAIIVSDMEKAYRHLRLHNVRHASTGPQRLPDWNPDAGGILAFYFHDPDGHTLEILQFPEGKGQTKWHRPTEQLFLGIDHTAIVVSHTETSLLFYRDLLGLRMVGQSENYGTEQEHLNNVFGARLRITALRAASGPGIEFLEYLTPRDGRPMPGDERANDVFHWHTRLVTPHIDSVLQEARNHQYRFVSPGPVRLAKSELGFSQGLLLRGPDGHVMQIIQR